ncbi:hypothetical protein JQ617_28820 [Bradyrhizobium sp. KB893862 SZCCT0404]|uniref:hypothetical protein n=1 Tax=Bradyrhizobium sp. KB893862 SZCCT0404 TaxID=2807672 RepID=UPI001BA62EE6|nr:hypothetical protein [Bradyrhizobium sp. KB893862 SZCCT0404]MBR1177996.1 hypothetical protein [Bradyrhizobium sp. KB893862 SZCCT0404]
MDLVAPRDGIEIPLAGSFADLRTDAGAPLLDADIAAHLDEQLEIARRAASAVNHDLQDVVTCCRADGLEAGPLADELSRRFFVDAQGAIARAKAIGEICEVAEEFCKDAIYLKATLASEPRIPSPLRRAMNWAVGSS